MARYEILWVAGPGSPRDYYDRQKYANDENCDLYVEQHFNAKEYDRPGLGDNPSFCLVGSNASETSKKIARTYSAMASDAFGTTDQGAIQVKFKGRGDYNLRFTEMPAFLPEPLFVSDPELATIAMSDIGQIKLANILVETIKSHFPAGCKVAFSIGHKYKVSSPHDRGAPVKGGGGLGEGDIAEAVLKIAAELLLDEDNEAEAAEVVTRAAVDVKVVSFDGQPIRICTNGLKITVEEA